MVKTLARIVADWAFPVGLIVAWVVASAYTVRSLAQAMAAHGAAGSTSTPQAEPVEQIARKAANP